MDAGNAKELIEKYQEGGASKEEIALIEKWIVLGTVKELDLSKEDLATEFSAIRSKLPLRYEQKAPKRVQLWKYVGAAAAVVGMVVGVWWYSSRYGDENQSRGNRPYAMDVAPGKNTATLILSDGKTINLSDKKAGIIIGDTSLAYSDGTRLSVATSQQDNQSLTAATPRGGTYQFTLTDGTRVWLNADSKVSFPSRFSGKNRTVMLLNGEAYFEVTKDNSHPFVVLTEDQKLEVLGTHFNISAYSEEKHTKTTLLEGSVQVSSLKMGNASGSKAVKLLPGQQAILNNDVFNVAAVNTDLAVDWKNGDFIFKDEDLESVMRKIARWYDVEIIYKNDYPQQVKLGGFISRQKALSAVLQLIESTGKVHFDIKGKNIIVGK